MQERAVDEPIVTASAGSRSWATVSTTPRWFRLLLPVVVGIAATAIAWLRLPPGSRDTLWAEDAGLFLSERLQHGPWASVVLPYDGYQHLVPRLVTDVAAALPAADYARTVTALSGIVVGLVAAAVVVFAAPIVRNILTLPLFALVPVLTPVVAFEVLGNAANLHTFLLFLVPVLLLFRPRTLRGSIAPSVIAFVIAMSEIQSLFFAPLLLLTARRRSARPIAGALMLGLALQIVSMAVSPRVRAPEHTTVRDAVTGWFLEPVLSVAYPKAASGADRLAESGMLVPVLLALVFVLAAAVVLVGRWHVGDGLGGLRTLTITLLVGSPLVWVAGVLLNPTPAVAFGTQGIGLIAHTGYLRYAAASSMFLVALVVLAAERLFRARRRWTTVVAVLVVVGWVALLGWRATPYDVARSGAPTWTHEIEDGQHECADGAADARIAQAPGGWGVTLDCRTIRTGVFPASER